MNRLPRRVALAVALAASLATMACSGQVLRIAGAADSTANGGSGAALSLYRQDDTTTLGAALQGGVHLGARREVSAGATSFALGDSTVALPLPSDLENTPRAFLARGLLLQNGTAGTLLFAGFTGATTSNSIISSVLPSRFVSVLSSRVALPQVEVSTLLTRGVRRNTLISVSHERNPFWRVAVTAGRSGSSNVLRTLVARQGTSYRVAVSENWGDLQLQPSVANQAASLERIGLNVLASRSFGRHWTLDGARHSYSTAGVGQNSLYQGVTAPRSELLEAGAILHVGSMQAQVRMLSASSGAQKSDGAIATAAWTAQRWSLQATYLQSRISSPGGTGAPAAATRSADLQAAHQVSTHLRLEETASLGANSNSASVGGSWTGDRFSVSVSRHQMFVPFGTRSGFHSVLLVSARLRIGGNEASTSVTGGGGLPTSVLLSTDGYYGAVQDGGSPQARPVRLPRFVVQGHVRGANGEPVRGAAVRIASTMVYTDSDGHFLARFDQDRTLAVQLVPEQFLSAQKYRDRSGVVSVQPTRESGDVLLTAERCNASVAAANDQTQRIAQDGNLAPPRKQGVIARTAQHLRLLTLRMFTWRTHEASAV